MPKQFTRTVRLLVHRNSNLICPLCGVKGWRNEKGWVFHPEFELADYDGVLKRWIKFEVDHIVPKSKGGKSVYSNARLLCRRCNRARNNRDETHIMINDKDGWKKVRVE